MKRHYNAKSTSTVTILLTIAALAFGAWGGMRVIKSVQFDQTCGGYLSRSANANTVELAKRELTTALQYMEKEKLTTGYTSVLWKTPNEDVGFWYENLKASEKELANVNPEASQLETSNVLMKLRETLTDSGEKGSKLVVPPGISLYPKNSMFFWWGWISALLVVGFGAKKMTE